MRASGLGLTPTSICQGLGRAGPDSPRWGRAFARDSTQGPFHFRSFLEGNPEEIFQNQINTFPHPNMEYARGSMPLDPPVFLPSSMCFSEFREKSPRKMIVATFVSLNQREAIRFLIMFAWALVPEQGYPVRTGLTRRAAHDKVSFSPYHPVAECHFGLMWN